MFLILESATTAFLRGYEKSVGDVMLDRIAQALGLKKSTVGTDPHEAHDLRTAEKLLRRDGLVVFRNALDRNEIERVSAAANRYMEDIHSRLTSGAGFDDLDKKLNFYAKTYACDLVAIDPETASGPNNQQFEKTALYRSILKGALPSLMQRALTNSISWQMARVRLVFADQTQQDSGALSFHQERTVTKFPGVHNIWTTLTPRGIVANRDTAGIQFYVGRRHELRSEEANSSGINEQLSRFNQLALTGEPGDADGYFYRPQLGLGDIVLFDCWVPHASYIPSDAKAARVSFDIRLFPTPNEPGHKSLPLAT